MHMRFSHAVLALSLAAALALLLLSECPKANAEYVLRVELDDAALRLIHAAGQQVVIARQPTPSSWFTVFGAFSPFERNYVRWNDTGYALYASENLPLADRTVVFEVSYVQPIYPGMLYGLAANGIFSGPRSVPGLTQDEFAVVNAYAERPAMVLGLAQDVNINNQWTLRVPLAATELILFEHDVFPVDPTLHIFLAPKGLQPGTMFANLFSLSESSVTTIPFRSSSSHVVQWDAQLGRFVRLS
jgi:hypothetical protein